MSSRPLAALFAVVAAGSLLTSSPASAMARNAADQEQVDRMRQRSAHAAQLLEEGEKLAASGALDEALSRFDQGLSEDPMGLGLFERRQCEVLASLGRHDEAVKVCWRAMADYRSPGTAAAVARALVSGPNGPSYTDVKQAMALLSTSAARTPDDPNLAATMCDIALTTGDGIMLERCTEKLERIAPDLEATRRARRMLDLRCPPERFWAGWIAILAAVLATAVHALRRAAKDRRLGPSLAGAVAVAMALTAWSATAVAQDHPDPKQWLSKWPVDDKDPLSSVPTPEQLNTEPLEGGYWLQDALSKAELSSKRGDHEAAIKYYQAILKAVPKRALPLIRMCDEFEAMGDTKNAMNACGLALLGEGLTVRDYDHYVRIMLRKPGQLTEQELQAINNVVRHVKDEQPTAGFELECEVGARTENAEMLRECTTALMASAPADTTTLTYRWALAVREGNFAAARAVLDEGAKDGMPEATLKHLRDATDAGASKRLRSRVLSGVGAVALAGALAYAYVLFSRRKRPVPATA